MTEQTCYDVTLPQGESVYKSNCPIIHALDIIGGKWKLPIIWSLAPKEPVRYNELKRRVQGITNMMLTKSLRELEEVGLIGRRQYDQVPPRVEYYLTDRGSKLIPALNALYAWGDEQLQRK